MVGEREFGELYFYYYHYTLMPSDLVGFGVDAKAFSIELFPSKYLNLFLELS